MKIFFAVLLSLSNSLALGSVFPTSWNVTQTTNGMIVSAGQMLGTNDGSVAADHGNVGEVYGPISRVRSSPLSLSNNTTANISSNPSIEFDPGHYIIYARACFGLATLTSVNELSIAVSATSATMPASDTMGVPTNGEVWKKEGFNGIIFGSNDYCVDLTPYPLSVATGSTKTLYFVARGSFSISTMSVWGSFYGVRIR